MTFEKFTQSLFGIEPLRELSVHLRSLWYEKRGDWERSHQLIQDIDDANAAWIHAYLHRKENDVSNADYWYGRAGRQRPNVTLDEEWEQIATELSNK